MSGPNIGPPLSHILEEEVAVEVLLYDDQRKLFVSLNETAADIWRLSTGEFSSEDIVSRIAMSGHNSKNPITRRSSAR